MESRLTCLLDSIADDKDVTPASTGRLRSVGPPVTNEAYPRPAHATALRAALEASLQVFSMKFIENGESTAVYSKGWDS